MNSIKWLRTLALPSLFITISLILYPSFFLSMAQSQSTPLNLEGTQWEGPPANYPTLWALGTVQPFLVFGKQGKVTLQVLAIQSPGLMAGAKVNSPTFNPQADKPFEPALVTTPAASAVSEQAGTYTHRGSSIRLEFSDHRIDATLEGNVMVGELTIKESNKKEKWMVRRILSVDANISNANADSVSSTQALLKTVIGKYNPMRLTTNTISGQLNTGNSGKQYYYIFTAIPGELTITLNVESTPQSSFNGVQFVLLDLNEKIIGSGTTMSNYGRTTQSVEKINITQKRTMLLRVESLNNLGSGKYHIQLSEAFEIPSGDSRGELVPEGSKSKQPTNDIDKQKKASELLGEANLLNQQGKYPEAIEVYSKHIQLDTEFTISAYIYRGDTKLKLQDYSGAIADYNQVLRLCVNAKADSESKMSALKIKDPFEGLRSAGEVAEKALNMTDTEKEYDKLKTRKLMADLGLIMAYNSRGTAKSRLGDKIGACEDFRFACVLGNSEACENSKRVCN